MNAAKDRADLDTAIRCQHCNHRGDQHRATDGQCPASDKFPKASKAVYSSNQEKAERAEGAWDRRIAKHWAMRTTTFLPRR